MDCRLWVPCQAPGDVYGFLHTDFPGFFAATKALTFTVVVLNVFYFDFGV